MALATNAVRDIMDRFNARRAMHANDGAEKSRSKRKPRIFPLKDPNKHGLHERKISGYTACGVVPGGEHKSIPGFSSVHEALNYGRRKGWTDRSAIASRATAVLAFLIGAGIGIAADRAQAAPVDDARQYAMVLTATEIMETAQCGTPERTVTFSRLADNGIEVRGRDAGLFLQTVAAIAEIYQQDPKGFCRRAGLAAGR